MKKILILILLGTALIARTNALDTVQAQADLFGAGKITDGLSDRTAGLMGEYEPSVQSDFGEGIIHILNDALRNSDSHIHATIAVMVRIFAIVILCRMFACIHDGHTSYVCILVGSLAITACCFSDIKTMIGLGSSVMDEINGFTTLLLPVMAAAATSSGAPAAGTVLYTVSSLFCDLFVRACRVIVTPMLYAFLALGLADSALGQNKLGKMREMIGWSVKGILKTVLYLFTGLLASTGIISGSADAAALKTAKLAISGMIPVVGGIVSDASESLLAGAGLLKSAVGTFGMLAVLAAFTLPFFRLGISYLGFKLTSAICGIIDVGCSKILDSLTAVMGYLLAMVGGCTVMSLISCCCFVKVASG